MVEQHDIIMCCICVLEDVMLRGRWASTKSTRIYIQAGIALLSSMRIPTQVGTMAKYFASHPLMSFLLARVISYSFRVYLPRINLGLWWKEVPLYLQYHITLLVKSYHHFR